jgi:hypothetical protein
VTRLGEFSPIRRFFYLVQFFFEKYLPHMFGLLLPTVNFGKKWIGLHLGKFFTNSSGHPEFSISPSFSGKPHRVHYGAICCFSCRAFFLRANRRKQREDFKCGGGKKISLHAIGD